MDFFNLSERNFVKYICWKIYEILATKTKITPSPWLQNVLSNWKKISTQKMPPKFLLTSESNN
jgi:hypothetical protein